MKIDTKSELTKDIEASISLAHDSGQPKKTQKQVREHLAYILPKLTEPNALIQPIKMALAAIEQRENRKSWFEKPIGVVSLSVLAGLLVAFVAFKAGWG